MTEIEKSREFEPTHIYCRPEMVFVVLALVFGMTIACVTAPFQAPDEAAHFWRAYHVSQGNLMTSREGHNVGGQIPRKVTHIHDSYNYLMGFPDVRVDMDLWTEDWNKPFNAQDKIFFDFFMPALYAPIVYVPQAIGIAAARACGASALQMMYAGRLSALLCWIIMVAAAIRIVPLFKWVFVLVALLPRNISLAASLSADGPTNAIVLLLTALILHAVFSTSSLGKGQLFGICLLCVLLSLAKQVYLPLAGLVLLIPSVQFGGGKRKGLFCGGVLAASVLATGLWSLLVRDFYTPTNGANAPEQLSFLIKQPWVFFVIAFKTFLESWVGLFVSFIGVLGFLDVWLPNWIYFTYPFALLAAALFDPDCKIKFGLLPRFWILLICIVIFLLIELSMYLVWTQVGASIVCGVHGRYFLPLGVPFLLALFYNCRLKLKRQVLWSAVFGLYLLLVLAAACWTVWFRFYGPAV